MMIMIYLTVNLDILQEIVRHAGAGPKNKHNILVFFKHCGKNTIV